MAWMNQEKKAEIAPKVKAVLQKYGMKGSLSVNGHSTLVLKLKSGKLDMIGNYNETMLNKPHGLPEYWTPATGELTINQYHYDENFTGQVKEFLEELLAAMNEGNHDRSDIMTDYFDVGWYVSVDVGQWNKPYLVI